MLRIHVFNVILVSSLIMSGCATTALPAPTKQPPQNNTSRQEITSQAQKITTSTSGTRAGEVEAEKQLPSNKIDETGRNEIDRSQKIVSNTIPYSVTAFKQFPFSGTSLLIEETLAKTAAYTRYRISYTSNEKKISGIMNIPVGEGPFPLLILNHGYIDPAVYTVGRGLKREQDFLARAGYVVLHTDYRGHGLSDSDEEMEDNYLFRNYFYAQDSINAILAVKEWGDARIDIEYVGMLGHSMGGGVTMYAMIARPDLIDAAILYAPVHSLEWYNYNRWRRSDMSSLEAAKREDKIGDLTLSESFAPYSSANFFDGLLIPVQIYHGTNDESVPYAWSVKTQELLTKADIPTTLITYTGERHEFVREWNNFMNTTDEFLKKTFAAEGYKVE